ncbi:aminotransferase class I/II-fold pyridoxal phosphate-dependent enzyme, partial [Patescibacteria group bacterium]
MGIFKQQNNSFIQAFIKKAPDSRFFGPDTGLIRLNHNEMTGLLPPSFVPSLLKNKNILSTYPSYDELHKIISAYIGIPEGYVQTVNGSDDAIPKLIRILFNNAKSVILPVPVFPTYERALKIEGVSITEIPYIEESNEFTFPLDAVKKAIRSKTNQGLVICNPSNPLGSGIDKKTLASLISETKNARIPLIVDEAYFE